MNTLTKELVINTGLAFVAGFVTSFAVVVASTPKNPGTAALLAAAGAAAYAGFRAAVGYVAAATVKPIPVDV